MTGRLAVSLTVAVAVFAAACSSDGGRGDELTTPTTVATTEPPATTPTTTFFEDPVVGPGGPQEADEIGEVEVVQEDTPDDHTHGDDGHTHDPPTSEPPVVTYPLVDGSGYGVLAPSTTEPSTTEPSTTEPSTTEPSTTEPSTTEPSTTEPSTTEPSTTEPSTTTPTVNCGGNGWVYLEEYATGTDNGCRPDDSLCPGGRNPQGWCRQYGPWLDTLVRDCPTVDISDGLGIHGGDMFVLGADGFYIRSEPAELLLPQMVAGSSWVADIQLVDNDNWDWKPGGIKPTDQGRLFLAGVLVGGYVPRVGEEQRATPNLVTSDEPEGSWSVSFTISEHHPPDRVFKAAAKTKGAGCWSMRFTRTG